jgi:hypothetical protein
MNIIEKIQTHNYQDNFTNEYVSKGGYLISDLVDYKSLKMQGGGIGINAVADFFKDLSIPSGLYVCNKPQGIGAKTKVQEQRELISDINFNNLLEGVFLSKPRGTHKKKPELVKNNKTRKKR